MIPLTPRSSEGSLRVLLLGAHSDDIEIGCAGTLLRWLRDFPRLEVLWAVFSASDEREREARHSAEKLLVSAARHKVIVGGLTDGRFPSQFDRANDFTNQLKRELEPDVVFTHRLEDRHQDHRIVAELTWQTWRDHMVLEYEIPKYEGDLAQPNVFVPLDASLRQAKLKHLTENFASQRSKSWFMEETFDAMLRLRGIECRAPSGFAEAFHARKLVVSH